MDREGKLATPRQSKKALLTETLTNLSEAISDLSEVADELVGPWGADESEVQAEKKDDSLATFLELAAKAIYNKAELIRRCTNAIKEGLL
jgi:hypothetical protein